MGSISVKDVARRAGVSVGTVSNVLNRPDMVTPATRQRVLDAIAELGFVRNESARTLRAGRSRTVGLVVLDVANPFFTDVARGAEAVADEHGAVVTLCNSGENVARERRYLEHLEEQRVQGILITPVGMRNPRLDQLAAKGIPVVLVDRRGGRGRCSVAVDDVLGGRLAVTHLVEQGHRRIAYISGPMSIRQVADRYKGAREAAEADGVASALVALEMPSLTVASGRQAAEQLAELPASRRPTAVFCANDLLALGVLQELTRQGLRVPDDVAIVGYDDIEYAGAAAVPLSSVRQPREQLGRAAAELLFEEIQDGHRHRHRHIRFEPELVVRASSAPRRRARASGSTAAQLPA
jgi:DNA-binding LacI/PurR family transcriptional regulator